MLKHVFKIVSGALLVAALAAEGAQEPAPSRAWVRSYVANNATTNGLMDWFSVTNYVMSALRANGVSDYLPEEDFTIEGDTLVCHATATGNGAISTPRTYTISRSPTVYSNIAARVVSSSLAYVPTGSVFTAFASGSRLHFRYFAATNLWLDLEHTSTVDTNGIVSATLVATNAAAGRSPLQIRSGTVHGTNYTWVSFKQTAQGFREVRCTGFANGGTNLASIVGSFTVVPARLSEGEWLIEAAKYRASEGLQALPAHACASGIACDWADRYAPIVTNGWRVTVLSASNRSAQNRPAPILSLVIPTAYAQYQEPPGHGFDITIPLVPNVKMVSFPPPDKDHFYVPDVWYAEADWNNRANWITFPIRATIYYQSDDDNLWYPQTINIKSMNQLDRLIPDLALPPYPWDSPILCKRKDYCKEGLHLWNKCACSKCGLVRPHGNWETSAGACARCGNHDSCVKMDGLNEVPVESEAVCGEKCDSADPSLHGGWHDGGGGDDAPYSCGCECGLYGAASIRLDHTLVYTNPKVCSYKNGQTHSVTKTCSRCGATRHLDEMHTSDPDSGSCEAIQTGAGYDMVNHLYIGHCTECDHDLEGLVEPHEPDENCDCACGLVIHDFKEDGCGFIKCEKCGFVDNTDERNQHGHIFGIYVDDKQHRCGCGEFMEDHEIVKQKIDGVLQDYCDICQHAFGGSGAKAPANKSGKIEADALLSRERGWSIFDNKWRKNVVTTNTPPPNVVTTNTPPSTVTSVTIRKRQGDQEAITLCEQALNAPDLTSGMTILQDVISQSESFYTKIGAVVLQWLSLDVPMVIYISCVIDKNGKAHVMKTFSFNNNCWLIKNSWLIE